MRINNSNQTQMTLGSLIAKLKSLPPDMEMEDLCLPHSYRGDYKQLAFESRLSEKILVIEALLVVQAALYSTYYGYKGGKYFMNEATPVNIASWGDIGMMLVDICGDGQLEVTEAVW